MSRSIRLLIMTAIFLIAATVGILCWMNSRSPDHEFREPSKSEFQHIPSDDESEQDLVQSEDDFLEDAASDPLADTDDTDMDTGSSLNAAVLHVVDGDTLDVDLDGTGEVRIRLLGVNTPETVDPRKPVECFGKAASDFSKRMMKEGDRIRVEADPQADERDKYGRLLRNIILANGTDYNALLIQEGYAHAYLGFPLDPERKVQLKTRENEAKAAGKGLWGADCR